MIPTVLNLSLFDEHDKPAVKIFAERLEEFYERKIRQLQRQIDEMK